MTPGDILFCHTKGVMGRAIRLGERLRFKRGSYWNHVCFVDRVEDDVVYVLQAERNGVTNDKPLNPAWTYQVVSLPDGADRERVLEFARGQLGSRYGWYSIFSILFDTVTPNWFPAFRTAGTWICSALTAESLRFGGWLHEWGDVYIVKPSDLWNVIE